MGKATHIKVSGSWKQVKAIWKKVSGVWQDETISWIKVSGTWKDCHVVNKIATDISLLEIDWQVSVFSPYCAMNVTPNSMATTFTKRDTGDGTSWAIVPASASGDLSFRARAQSSNGTTARQMAVDITDNAGLAITKTIIVRQVAQPY